MRNGGHLACFPGLVSYITNAYGSDDVWFSTQHLQRGQQRLADAPNSVPLLFRIVSEIVNFSDPIWKNSVSRDEVSVVHRAAVTEC
jgi:hypothetical protein